MLGKLLNRLLNPSPVCWRGIPSPPVLLLVGMALSSVLSGSGVALAQSGSVNDAIRRDSNPSLFDGTSINVNDLFRAADFLSRQSAASRWDGKASVDAAVEQFNQSRRRSLLLSPASLTPEPTPTP
ncbi:hypothetical protein NW849_02800 [Synechococcus sp. R55.3]|uniref:hypothetical protein n=1 Tax=unclassified Synechococcus TaxID=2626047 RepID=UPI0039C331C2